MPEIWLNYGQNEVVLDIQAENLNEKPSDENKLLAESKIDEKLDALDLSKPVEIAILNYTNSAQEILTKIFKKCEEKSFSNPKILVNKRVIPLVKSNNPENISINEFDQVGISDANLTFLSEMEFDGLFGFETIATRLLKQFGKSEMLDAFKKRDGDLPIPGKIGPNMQLAEKFVDGFEISSIEIIANVKGIYDFSIGHPKNSISLSQSFVNSCVKTIDRQRTMIISTGKDASNETLNASLSSLWNCYSIVKNQGFVVLLAECLNGIGSDAFQQFIDGRLTIERVKNGTKYVDGMENLLYLSEIQKKFQVGLVSVLPEIYLKKLGVIPIGGIKKSMDYILKNLGQRQKVEIVNDGARTLLREN
jgi:hypothetical protein